MNRPFFKDTRGLTERRKAALALAQALENKHSNYRVEELTHRLMALSIITLDDEIDDREILDYWGE